MNYFPFHIGDYTSHTAHLEPIEDLAYRRMLDAYYLREGSLPCDINEIARLIRLKNNHAEIDVVLREFFQLTLDGWIHVRCEEELTKMKDKQAKAKASAHASVKARSANAQRTLSERSANAELPTPTPTPTPITKNKEQRGSRLASDWVLPKTWGDWALTERQDLDPRKVAEDFRDYWHSVAGAKGVKLDWQATWRVWVRSQKAQRPQIVDVARQTVPSGDEYEQSKARVAKTFEGTRPPTKEEREALTAAINRMKVKP